MRLSPRKHTIATSSGNVITHQSDLSAGFIPQLVEAVLAAEADGTYVKVTAAAIKEECPGEWQRGLITD